MTVAAPHSLLGSANLVEEREGSRWEGGFTFKPENCIEAEVWQPCGPDGEIRVLLEIDATGGSFVLQYDGDGEQELPFNVSAAQLLEAMDVASDGISAGYVNVHDGTGDSGAVGARLFVTITQPNPLSVPLFDPNGFNFSDSTTDPLTGGGAAVNFTILGIGDYQGFGSDVWPQAEQKKDYDGFQTNLTYHPFVVEVPYSCSTWGFEANDYEAKALHQLEAGLSKAMEHEFWTGDKNPSNINLVYWTPNDDAHVLNPGGAAAPDPVDAGTGIILLEAALARCGPGGRGYIHMTTEVATKLGNAYVVDDDDTNQNRFLSTRSRDDIVIVGAGYTGDGPFGQPAPSGTEMWAFATGQVDVRLGEPEVVPNEFWMALDRATNTVTFRGEQVASVVHDGCCSFAVLIDWSLPVL
jgi:hypothetical protein